MIFDDFDSRTAGAGGAEMHVCQPVNGEPIFDNGKPCIVIVRGMESREAVQAVQAVMRETAKRKKDDLTDRHEDLLQMAVPLVLGFKNMQRKDPQTGKNRDLVAPDDVFWFLNLQRASGKSGQVSFVEQVANFAADRANYLGNVSGG
jgi:hypothetical protein